MSNFTIGKKFRKQELTKELVDWLNSTQHYLEDISEGEYVYRVVKTPELPREIHIENLRGKRAAECFSIINRGQIWYDTLSEVQLQELKIWYQAWLNVTETMVEPAAPAWLK